MISTMCRQGIYLILDVITSCVRFTRRENLCVYKTNMEPISEQLRRISRRNQPLRFKALLSLSLFPIGVYVSLFGRHTKVPRRLQDRQSPPVWILRRGIMATHSGVIWKGISSLDNTAPLSIAEDLYNFFSLYLYRSP